MTTDPFARLGLPSTAGPDDVRRARRELAKRAHPDVGGDAVEMRGINDAAAAALRVIAARSHAPSGSVTPGAETAPTAARDATPTWQGARRDMPSFTVEALPVETFEALLLAASVLGEIEDDDPPYGLDVLMVPPLGCWCHLAVVPDAGASTVSLTVAPGPDAAAPPLDEVRDAWIHELNSLDWNAIRTG